MSSPTPLAEPMSLSALLDKAMRLVRRHLRSLLVPFATPLALVGAAMPIAQLALQYSIGPHRGAPPIVGVLVWFGVVALSMLVYGLVYVAVLAAATDAVAGRVVSGERAWRVALDLRVIGTMLLVTLAWVGGLAFCILPGIYVALILTAVVPVMVNERRFGSTAMRRSAELMRFNPERRLGSDPRARSFLLGLTGGLIGYAVSMLVQLPMMIIMMAFVFRETAAGREGDPRAFAQQMLWVQIPSNIVGTVLQGLIYVYVAFGIALIYFDVLHRKEGTDLLAASERLVLGTSGEA